jgi:hypothetical protein
MSMLAEHLTSPPIAPDMLPNRIAAVKKQLEAAS